MLPQHALIHYGLLAIKQIASFDMFIPVLESHEDLIAILHFIAIYVSENLIRSIFAKFVL